MLTRQEVFDRTVQHLAEQGGRSSTPTENVCAYRGAEGRKCSVGYWILDERYSENMEGMSISPRNVNSTKPREFCIMFKNAFAEDMSEHILLLIALQKAHDFCALSETKAQKWIDVWEGPHHFRNFGAPGIAHMLTEIATSFGLSNAAVLAAWPQDVGHHAV